MKYLVLFLMIYSLSFASEISFEPVKNESIFLNKKLENYTSISEAILSDDVKDGDVLILKGGDYFEEIINISKNITIKSFENSTIIGNINIIDSAECVFENLNFGLEQTGELSSNINVISGELTVKGIVQLKGYASILDRVIVPIGSDFVILNDE